MPVDGACLAGSALNASKIEILKKSKRRLIFVIDRDQTGGDLGQSILANGWELTFVDVRADDINDSIQKFGRCYTIYSLIKNATAKAKKDQSQLALSMGLLEAKLRRNN